jgi:hypothetical protein
MTGHDPAAKTWHCLGCTLPWPCPASRANLLKVHKRDPFGLAIWMGWALVAASRELTDEPAGALYARFVGWVSTAIRDGTFSG